MPPTAQPPAALPTNAPAATTAATAASAAAPTTVATTGAGAPTAGASAAASSAQAATPKIVAAANAFLATLDSGQKSSALFDWSNTAQKQRWSNLPQGLYERAGVMWGDINETQQNAWLALMQATLSAEGYNRVLAEWNADDALAAAQGSGGGGPGGQLLFGKQYYWVAIIGTPSETSAWQWQWGGHHVTVNATIAGPNIALTPSFIGVQPASYTDSSGNTVRPLGDIEDEAFALVGSLDASQQKAAILGSSPIDLVLGPGQDGKTIQSEGLPAAQMNADQQAALLKLIGHYTGLANNATAAARLAEGIKLSSLLAMGVSGGLVPCPEALGILVIAIGLNRILLGLGLIVSFSFGLAAVLIAIGILLVRSRSLLERFGGISNRFAYALPLASAAIVTVLGAGIALSGLATYLG